MKTSIKVVLVFLLMLLLFFVLFPKLGIISVFRFLAFISGEGKVIQTTDIADYGVITGNYDNETPKEFVFSFFPEKISDDYSNVSYQYTAQKGDAYACQVWLEFDIEDEEKFTDFISAYTDAEQTDIFQYDSDYMDYTVLNHFELTHAESDKPGDIHIEYAEIGKILYNQETQHIICYALCMYDGGYSTTKIFGDFFTRFNIDPVEYEATATTPYLPISSVIATGDP